MPQFARGPLYQGFLERVCIQSPLLPDASCLYCNALTCEGHMSMQRGGHIVKFDCSAVLRCLARLKAATFCHYCPPADKQMPDFRMNGRAGDIAMGMVSECHKGLLPLSSRVPKWMQRKARYPSGQHAWQHRLCMVSLHLRLAYPVFVHDVYIINCNFWVMRAEII